MQLLMPTTPIVRGIKRNVGYAVEDESEDVGEVPMKKLRISGKNGTPKQTNGKAHASSGGDRDA